MEKSKNILNKLKGLTAFLYKDFHWKLLSLFLAFMLWFVGVNINDPVQIQAYPNLPLNVIGREHLALNRIVLLNETQINNSRIDVSVRGIRSNHELIQRNRAENIQASIDLSTIDFDAVFANANGTILIPMDVNVSIQQDYISHEISPSQVELRLDRLGYRSMPIRVEVLGSPREGYEQRDAIPAQTMVRLSGARSALDEVYEVRASIHIDDAYETVEEMEQIVVYNRDGQIITGTVNLSAPLVHVRVPIFPYAGIPLSVNTIGNESPNYMVTEVVIDPPTIELVGNLDEITSINLGNIDINNAEETIVQTFDISQALQDTGLTIRAGAPTEATATVVIEGVISRDFSIPLSSLFVSGATRPYTFVNAGALSLSLRGRESIINALNLNQISASINLTGLGVGTHTVPVTIRAVPGAIVVNPVTTIINIQGEPVEPYEPQPPEVPPTENGPYEPPEDDPYEPIEPDYPEEPDDIDEEDDLDE